MRRKYLSLGRKTCYNPWHSLHTKQDIWRAWYCPTPIQPVRCDCNIHSASRIPKNDIFLSLKSDSGSKQDGIENVTFPAHLQVWAFTIYTQAQYVNNTPLATAIDHDSTVMYISSYTWAPNVVIHIHGLLRKTWHLQCRPPTAHTHTHISK